jgi:hypothetical protein
MKKPIKNYFAELRQESLTSHEKETMRIVLQSYMRENAVTAHSQQPRFYAGFIYGLSYVIARPVALVSALLVFFMITAGTSYAAEGSLPDDLLYPIKIHVTEPIRAAFAVTPQAKAQWNIGRTAKRLQEAEQLSASETLDTSDVQVLNELIQKSTSNVTAQAVALAANHDAAGSASVFSSLESTLKTHAEILLHIGNAADHDAKQNISRILDTTVAVAQQTEQSRSRAEQRVGARTPNENQRIAAENIRSAEQALKEARYQLEQDHGTMSSSTVARVSLSINAAHDSLAGATHDLNNNVLPDAFTQAQQARRLALEATTFTTSATKLHFNVFPTDPPMNGSASTTVTSTATTTVQFREDDEHGSRLQKIKSGAKKLKQSAEQTSTSTSPVIVNPSGHATTILPSNPQHTTSTPANRSHNKYTIPHTTIQDPKQVPATQGPLKHSDQ